MQQMKDKSLKTTARQYCANYFIGNCLGCMMVRKDGVRYMRLSKKLADKECVVDQGCDYFDNIVVPGVNNGY